MSSNIWVLTALGSWGLWGIFEKKALGFAGNRDVITILYLLHLLQIPVYLACLCITCPHWSVSFEAIAWSGVASALYAVALLSYLRALSKTDASYVLGSTACYPVISFLLAIVFLGEKLVLTRLIGAIVVAAGVFAMSYNFNSAKSAKKTVDADVMMSVILATIAWGTWGIVDKKAVSVASPLEICLIECLWHCVFLIIVAGIFYKQGHKFQLRNTNVWKFCGLSTVCLTVGGLAYLTAMTSCAASYVITITSCYPVIMYVLALAFLKEQFSKTRFAGISLIVLGAVLVQLTMGS